MLSLIRRLFRHPLRRQTGASVAIILAMAAVQVFYQMPVIDGPLGFSLSTMAGDNRLLEATAVFRNEPY